MHSHLEQFLTPLILWDTCMRLSPMTEDLKEINALLEKQQEAGGRRWGDKLNMSWGTDTWVKQTIHRHKSMI